MRELLIQLLYFAASILLILGVKGLTKPDTARRGIQYAGIGMLLAIVGTLLFEEIVSYGWIVGGMVLGTIIGLPIGKRVAMTAMPQLIAATHMLGAVAVTVVGVAEYLTHGSGGDLSRATMTALGFEVLLGALTITGSFMAFGKLQGFLPDRPIVFTGQNAINLTIFASTFLMLGYLVYAPATPAVFFTMIALALAIGVSMVIPIGGADMPVVISLLNSYAGLAASATGFAIDNNVLVICGALDGTAGFILSILMSKAMNRSFTNVLFGGFGNTPAVAARTSTGLVAKPITIEDAAMQLAYASKVIVIPGYGMAVAQSQHQVRELADLIEKRGGEVKYAIHPVAGRMPGHLNVILADAGVEYDRLLTDVDDANQQLGRADVAIVIGANDIVNPSAEDDKGSPIYGMPVLQAWNAQRVFVVKRGQGVGFAGIENPLFFRDNTNMLYGDAKKVASGLTTEVKAMEEGH
ncbi:MAG: NAD(P)(+) transhydrogenase (Re/Si-specific) subunit beta [Gemmatirosa sp.]|nr:NAD(P)(+) transhydrogenase (Re/Si-specific) subunit beta [Gemmatirosa sp.]